MEQQTTDWLAWRLSGIGSSDAPVILKKSPWCTPYQLWEEKFFKKQRNDSNWATERGNRLESKVRAWYELRHEIEMKPDVGEHAEFPFMRASFDGINLVAKGALEIKCPGKEDHATAKMKQIPEKYYPQVQHQIFVAGLDFVDYVSWFDEKNVEVVRVMPDLPFIETYFKAAQEFWFDHVLAGEPPELTDKDFTKIPAKAKKTVALFLKYKQNVEEATALMEAAKKDVLGFLPKESPRAKGYGLSVYTSFRKGNVDYKKVPELQGVDLEKYRGKPSQPITFRPVKESE